jgi:hypothetical protein
MLHEIIYQSVLLLLRIPLYVQDNKYQGKKDIQPNEKGKREACAVVLI